MDKKIHVRFGKYVFAFFLESIEIADFFKLHFNKYISGSAQDVSIKISVMPLSEVFPVKPGTRYKHSFHKKDFNFGPDLILGEWDEKNRTWNLAVSKFLLNKEKIWLFDRLFCRLLYSLKMEHKADREKAVIIHSSGILKEKRGYLFFGPPGSGKSTIAGLSGKFRVLHDDMNLVTLKNNTAFVEGVPFNPKNLARTNISAPLSMMCSLHKNNKVKIERGTPEEFVKSALPEVLLPLPVLSEDRKAAFQYILRCIKELGEHVPYCRLYFKKDESFWDEILKTEENHAGH